MKSPWMVFLRCIVVAAAAVGLSSKAVPITYTWDDTSIVGGAGVGQFTLDLPNVPADTGATGVSGSGTFLGSWQGVSFLVAAGQVPSLTISNLTGVAVGFTRLGDVSTASSSSAQEWLDFTSYWTRLGVKISEVSTPVSVPDHGPSLPFTVATVAGLCSIGHYRRRVTRRQTVGTGPA
ncbi:MAG: hypothetical protein IT581_07785 [Verrucomicrobiales bacterium]|nr:hypothetical protein [Verrucomicrobiales bacterium]